MNPVTDDPIAALHAEALGAPCGYCGAQPTEPCRNVAARPRPDGTQPTVRVPHATRIGDRRRAKSRDRS